MLTKRKMPFARHRASKKTKHVQNAAAMGTVQLVERINKGLPISSWDTFIQVSGLNADEVSEVVMLPLRTLSRRRAKGKLEAAESDRLMRFSMIVDKAVNLFEGDVAGAREWLRTPQPALGGNTPIDFSKTNVGAREVEDLIGRLDQGVYT